ncbi:MAG: serine hydrolase domain-containing protein, partial [Gemmatimonadaceae bacterium]
MTPTSLPGLSRGAFLLTLALAPLSAPSFSQAQAVAQIPTKFVPATESIQRLIEREMEHKALPALSIALVDDQQVVWARGFGIANQKDSTPATAETVYRVGSVSKLFTDIAIMQLVERGELDLDAPIQRYLPDFRPINPFGKPITLRQMMAHRSGLVREPPVGHYFDNTSPSLAATVKSLNSTSLVYEPGQRSKYSNAAISVVGYVLERRQQEPFPAYMKRMVLDPVGLQHTSFEPTPATTRSLASAFMWGMDRPRFPAPTFELGTGPAGNLYSTVTDLGRFMTVLFGGGRAAGGPLLRTTTLEQMWVPQFASPGATQGFGLGFAISELDGHRRVGHGGAIYGFATELSALPDAKLGVAVATNVDVTNTVTGQIGEFALRAMLAARAGRPMPEMPALQPLLVTRDTLPSLPLERPSASPPRLNGLIGEYGWDHNILYILEHGGKLWALIEWFFAYPLEEISRDVFAFPKSGLYDGERLIFTRQSREGKARQVKAASVVFKRRVVGPETGSTQLRITPTRSVAEL